MGFSFIICTEDSGGGSDPPCAGILILMVRDSRSFPLALYLLLLTGPLVLTPGADNTHNGEQWMGRWP